MGEAVSVHEDMAIFGRVLTTVDMSDDMLMNILTRLQSDYSDVKIERKGRHGRIRAFVDNADVLASLFTHSG